MTHPLRDRRAPATARPLVEEYLSAPAPKLLVVASGDKGAHWVANPGDLDGARQRVLTRCREASGVECAVAMEDNVVVERVATRATLTRSVAR